MKTFEFKGFIALNFLILILFGILFAYLEFNYSWLFLILAVFVFFFIPAKAKFDHFNKVEYNGKIQGDTYYEIEKVYKFYNIYLQDLVIKGNKPRIFKSLQEVNKFISKETKDEIKNFQNYSKKESKIFIEL